MKRWLAGLLWLALISARADEPLPHDPANLSVRNEIRLAIDKALGWLATQQREDGSWSDGAQPGLTALPLLGVLGNPQRPDHPAKALDSVRRGLSFLRRQAREDGGLYARVAPRWNTALALSALRQANLPEDDALMAAAERFLARPQAQNEEGLPLPTLALTIDALPEGERMKWQPAIRLLASKGASGSETCAALLALLDTKVLPSDPAVVAGLRWLGDHYALGENPGAGRADYFLYLYLQAKALQGVGRTGLQRHDGRAIDWAVELGLRLINGQTSAGTWLNPEAETDPVLTTSYGLLAMEIVYRQL